MEPKIPAARPSSDESTTGAAAETAAAETASEPTAAEATTDSTEHAGDVIEVPAGVRAPRTTGTTRPRAAAAARTAAAKAMPATKTAPATKATTATRATSPAKTAAKATRAAVPATAPSAGDTPSAEPAPASDAAPVDPVPVRVAAPVEPVDPAPATALTTTTVVAPAPAPLWERLRANPRYAPELLAVAAVQMLGGQVDEHARWLVATYPHATADSIARYAARRYARQAGYVSLAGTLARPWGTLAGLAGYIWVRARLVLLTAAAYGHDPRDPERVPELLVLLGVHPDLPAARTALADVQTGRRSASAGAVPSWLGLAKALATPLSRARRGRPSAFSLPGVRPLAGVIVDVSATEALARRAVTMYRPASGRDRG